MLSRELVILYGFSFAFFVVNMLPRKIRLQTVKPFSCVPCLTGWSCLILGLIAGYGVEAIGLMFLGVFTGAMFEVIIMRYL